MPQSSRMIVTVCACFSQAATSLSERFCAASGASARSVSATSRAFFIPTRVSEAPLETLRHRLERAIRLLQRRDAVGTQLVEFAAASAALGGRLADPRAQQPLAL